MRYWRIKFYKTKINQYYSFKNIKQKKLNNFYQLWRLGYSGFYGDELYARYLENYFRVICLVPAVFILDKWVSRFMGVEVIKRALQWINKRFYYQRVDLFVFINLFILGYILIITGAGFIEIFISYNS